MTPDLGPDWPPASVLGAAGLLAGPPAAGLVVGLLTAAPPPALGVLGAWGLAAGLTAARLLRGHPGGVRGAAGLLGLFALFAGAIALGIALGGAYRDLPPAVLALGYPVTGAALLAWPETRRWCGLLPPDPGDDA